MTESIVFRPADTGATAAVCEPARIVPMRMLGADSACPHRISVLAEDRIVAEFLAPADSLIFSGHYPRFPLLPGVFMIEAALQAIDLCARSNGRSAMRPRAVRNLQLLQAIEPEQWVGVEANRMDVPAEGDVATWRIRLHCQGDRVASCTIGLASPTPDLSVESHAVELFDGARFMPATEIARSLAHRPPVLLVDAAWRSPDLAALRSHKLVSLNEPCYAALPASFRDDSLAYPFTMIIESFVQSAGLLLVQPSESATADPDLMIFGGLGECRVHGEALPGQTLVHDVRLQRRLGSMAVLAGSTRCEGRLLTEVSGLIVAFKKQHELTTSASTTRRAA